MHLGVSMAPWTSRTAQDAAMQEEGDLPCSACWPTSPALGKSLHPPPFSPPAFPAQLAGFIQLSPRVMLWGGYEPLAVLCGGGLSPPGRPSVVQSELEWQELPLSLRPWVQWWSGGWSRSGKTAAAVAGDEDSVRLCPLRPSGPRAAPSRALPPIAICSPRGSGCQRGLCAVAQVS